MFENLPSSTSQHGTGDNTVHMKNSTGTITHNNYNCGPGVFNDVRRDQHVRGDQHFRGDQHVHGDQHATTFNFTFNSKGAGSGKEAYKDSGPHAWEQEPYRTIINMLSRIRQRLLWCAERFELDNTAAGVCNELDELVPLVESTAMSVEQIGKEFPLMFKSPFITRAQQSAFTWTARLKALEKNVEEFNQRVFSLGAPEVPTAPQWSSLSQRLLACIHGPRVEMTLFLRIISASYFFRKLDMRHGRVEELIMKLSLKWNLHNPSVDTIWVREPTGLNWFSIPLNFCETWQEFSTVIYEYCRNGPEIDYIRQGNWAIVRDSDNNIIDQTQFTSVLKPEMRFDIGVIMQLLSGMADTCPQCQHRNNKSISVDGWIQCSNADCGNWFHISFHTSQPSNVPNIKSNKPVARKGRQISPSTVIPKLARTSVQSSRSQTPKFQRLSPKFRRILATIPCSPLEEAEAKKSRGAPNKKAKEDSGGEAGTKTAAKQVIGNRGHAEIQQVQVAFMSKESAPHIANEGMLDLIQAAAKRYNAVCPNGYRWMKSKDGYVCGGGGHKLTWEQLGM
ncbi:hypothetical protein EYR40_009959 [Pleurotus pulmonarius]|nr:hypothetical protein EYR40_009959 [Pleurotus pulmonarius]